MAARAIKPKCHPGPLPATPQVKQLGNVLPRGRRTPDALKISAARHPAHTPNQGHEVTRSSRHSRIGHGFGPGHRQRRCSRALFTRFAPTGQRTMPQSMQVRSPSIETGPLLWRPRRVISHSGRHRGRRQTRPRRLCDHVAMARWLIPHPIKSGARAQPSHQARCPGAAMARPFVQTGRNQFATGPPMQSFQPLHARPGRQVGPFWRGTSRDPGVSPRWPSIIRGFPRMREAESTPAPSRSGRSAPQAEATRNFPPPSSLADD